MNSKVSEQTKDIESSRKTLQGFLSLTACIESREDLVEAKSLEERLSALSGRFTH